MRLRLTKLLILILTSLPMAAQEEFVLPPARLLTTFTFKTLTGGIITLRARINNLPDTLTFILDTGSGGISLDSATTVALNLKTTPSDRTIRGIAGMKMVNFAYNQVLHLPGLTVDSLNMHVNDYDILTSAYGEKIDGIIGYSVLSRYIVKVDYDSSKIHIFTKGTFKYPRGGYLLRTQLVNIPILGAEVKDARTLTGRFYFDTGAGMCLLMSSDFVNDSSVVSKRRKWYSTQAEGLGGKAPMKQGVVKALRFGPYKFRNVPTYIFDDEYNVTQYPSLGGLIGNDLFRRFNLYINYEQRQIYMVPNSHFKDAFDYSYTGLGMYLIEGEIRIIDIMPGSPAEESGFQPEDVIIAVQNNFSKNIQAYKNLMQTPGEKLKVLVLRDGLPKILVLKVKNILTGR
jgi:hypothetical protein